MPPGRLKAARALDLALQAGNTPLGLQVGADAIAAVRAHAEQLLNDLATARCGLGFPRHSTESWPESSRQASAADTPSVIPIHGDNPAIIRVGATITGPQTDLNLGGRFTIEVARRERDVIPVYLVNAA
jgi:hypothetical protein